MVAATKKKRKEEAYPWKAGTSSVHLKQSILEKSKLDLSSTTACDQNHTFDNYEFGNT
jgi:hypothetical protein